MRLPRFKSIRFKLIAVMMLVASSTALAGYVAFLSWFMSNQQHQATEQAQSISLMLGQEFARILLLNDINAAADLSSKLRSFPTLESMVLFDANQQAVHVYNRDAQRVEPIFPATVDAGSLLFNNGVLDVLVESRYLQSSLGHVLIRMEVLTLEQAIKRDLPVLSLIGLLMLFFSFLLAFLLEKRFTSPIYHLIAFLDDIVTADQLNNRLVCKDNNEFCRLYAEVNTMLERLESSQRQLKISSVAFNIPSGMMITDKENRIIQINPAFTQITGYQLDELLGQTPTVLSSGRQDKAFYRQMWQDLEQHSYWSGEIWNRHKSGHVYPEFLTIQPVRDQDGHIEYFVGSFIDLTHQKDAEQKLLQLTYYDSLTRLANRTLLIKTLDSLLEKPQSAFVLICFDIENFKLVNDSLGQAVGDMLLTTLAGRLNASLDSVVKLIARLGSDEFAVIYCLKNEDVTARVLDVEAIVQQVLSIISEPFQLGDQLVRCQGKAGISQLCRSGQYSATDILTQANTALHQAKNVNDQGFAFFDSDAQDITRRFFTVQADLLSGLEQNQFELYYQPQTTLEGELLGVEALIRWQHPDKGMVSPAEFIPVAEQSGLIVELGDWVLAQACRQLAAWQQCPHFSSLTLSINVSSKQFYQLDFVEKVQGVLRQYPINPSYLKLELTESLLVQNIEQVIDNMNKLSGLGIKISLDDFGTGYSSLSYLHRLPLNQIKIDQSFVRHLLNPETKSQAIVKTIISLCAAYGFDVIAEGVETQEELDVLQKLGCAHFQGYYFSRPLPVTVVEQTYSKI